MSPAPLKLRSVSGMETFPDRRPVSCSLALPKGTAGASSLTRWWGGPEGEGVAPLVPSGSRLPGPKAAVRAISAGSPRPSSPGSKSAGSEDHAAGQPGVGTGRPLHKGKGKERPRVPSTNKQGARGEAGQAEASSRQRSFLTRHTTPISGPVLSAAALTGVAACRRARGLARGGALPRGQRRR